MRIIFKYSLVILLFIFFSSESYSQPRVLKCKGDCGTLDESNKYSAVARLCYGSSSDPLGSDVTFIEDDIIITQAHIFGNPRKTAPCCGGDCEKKADDWKRYKNNMFVCDGTDYGKKGKIRIGKVIDVEFRMTETFGYDIAIAHIDRDCDQCNRDVKIDPIPLANSLPKLGADAVHVHVGDPRNRNTRRSSPHKLIWPVVGAKGLECVHQYVKADGIDNPPMVFNVSGSPVMINECGKTAVHGFHGTGEDDGGFMYERLQLVQAQKQWAYNQIKEWTGRDEILDACSESGYRSFTGTEDFDVTQRSCIPENSDDEVLYRCGEQEGALTYKFDDDLMNEFIRE